MSAGDDSKIASCLHVLKTAKSDNDKFAAMLLVAKLTTSVNLTDVDRKDLLDAIGMQFLVRLLKSKSVPEGCPANIYKSMSLSILSGLCTDPSMIEHTNLWKCLKVLDEILVMNSDDEVDRQMIDNCYDILQLFVQTDVGVQQLIDNNIVPTICNVVVRELYGSDKAWIMLQTLMLKSGPSVWSEQYDTLHTLLEFITLKLDVLQDENKFKYCKILAEVIRTIPEDKKETILEKDWVKRMIKSTRDIFTSKLGGPQREPALELVSVIAGSLGAPYLLPPYTTDSKLLLIVTHLGCIETRMILENTPVNQIGEKSNLLCSCYQLLEAVINHMTTAPSLMLDDQQVLQLHAGMTGAFNAVILFLKELSEMDSLECPLSVVIATLRVLGAWLAEETSALREKVYEILPFLIRICKSNFEENKKNCKKVSFKDEKTDYGDLKAKDSVNLKHAEDQQESCDMDISDKMADCDISNKEDGLLEKSDIVSEPSSTLMEHSQEENVKRLPQTSQNLDIKTCQLHGETKELLDESGDKVTCMSCDNSIISCDKNDQVDLLKFMLPGLCHLTAEDKPREILLSCKTQKLLDQYLRWSWDLLQLNKTNIALQGSMETLCNVFLNLAVTEPDLAADDKSLQNTTQLIMEAVPVLDENSLTLKVNMITLGLMLLRQNATTTEKYPKTVKVKFFTSVMMFIKGVHMCEEVNSVKTLTVSEMYLPVWEEIYQLWLLSLQALKSCVSIYPEIEESMLATGLIPHLCKMFISVQGKGVTDDIKDSVLSLLTSVGTNSPKVREVLRSTGGQQLARLYRLTDLQQILDTT